MKKEIRVLYLEDDPADVTKAQTELQKAGLVIHMHRADTRNAFTQGLELSPDVILSDHGLPSFDGLTALSVTRDKCPDVPFIFVTNALSREMEIEKLMGGVTDYVRKSQLDYLPIAVLHALHEVEERRAQRKRLLDILKVPADEHTHYLPICSHCKKIRDENNQWKQPEIFLLEHLNLNFTHSICPQCLPRYR
ncbi:MAG TPA: response regulator [Verrucomicrobiae bacterium]